MTRKNQANTTNIVKTFANATVAYGLRARAHLFSLKYKEAADDAQKPSTLQKRRAGTLPGGNDVAIPAFIKLQDKSFIWGMYADPVKVNILV